MIVYSFLTSQIHYIISSLTALGKNPPLITHYLETHDSGHNIHIRIVCFNEYGADIWTALYILSTSHGISCHAFLQGCNVCTRNYVYSCCHICIGCIVLCMSTFAAFTSVCRHGNVYTFLYSARQYLPISADCSLIPFLFLC